MARTTTRLALTFAAIGSLLLAWSTAAPWAAGSRGSSERYKVSLFGVWHVVAVTSSGSDQVRCSWDSAARSGVCAPNPGHTGQYARLAFARWFVIAAIAGACVGLIALGREGLRAAGWSFMISGATTIVAIILLRTTVRSALIVLADIRLTLDGSGLNAAQVASTLMLVAGLLLLTASKDERMGIGFWI